MILEEIDEGRLTVDQEPLLIRFESDIFLTVTKRGYMPAAKVMLIKTKGRFYLLLGAQSLCEQIEPIRKSNGGHLLGVEVWIRKDGPEKMAKYVIEQ
jgi:hypothetical protein